MADLSHLEKMGRELKCPICLSLLKSAVSLACNHVFCNVCVMESMKSVSDCPVCKVPFRRREVRPAPHMDNLVTVFKSMEVAAGVNIFTTQVGPSTKNPGYDEKNSDVKETMLSDQGRSKKKGSSNKRKQKSVKTDDQTSDFSQAAKPSFPAKKRVHVTPYPVSETPVRQNVSKPVNADNEFETGKSLNKDKRIYSDGKQDDTLFSPFFWLREENNDEDGASGKPSCQPTADASQTNIAPCFSDIKDSEDDKSPIKRQFNAADAFDSEMFEWTQRACSPELCSTPLKKQTTCGNKLDAIQEKDCLVRTALELNNEVLRDESEKSTAIGQTNVKDQRTRTFLAKKRTCRPRRKQLKKCSGILNATSLDELHVEVQADSVEIARDSSQEDEDEEQKELPICERRISSKGRKSANEDQSKNNAVVAQTLTQVPTNFIRQKIQIQEADVIGKMRRVLTSNADKNDAGLNVQNETKKRGKRTTPQSKKKLKLSMNNAVSEGNPQNQEHQKAVTSLQVCSSKPSENGNTYGNSSKAAPEIPKLVRESKGKAKMTFQTGDIAVNSVNEIHVDLPETGMHTNNDSFAAEISPRANQVCPNNEGKILRKCGNIHSQMICAFCQSFDATKDSGKMLHYFNGKPVAADYNGVNVIHSHKHCTEWAPDVYFEDDVAINLTAELARSRRIKCSCCGIKGAALGCYEKNCRKSFHFTCAKLIPECRWDNDNFVMLCPLHASSRLPNEVSGSLKHRKRPSPRGEVKNTTNCKTGNETSQMWKWPSGSPLKWVLCCSALTAAEKDIISEFTRMSGIPISKTWSPAVTHVIASTDENGACKRTLKFLMGILDGKWILSIEWIKACLKAMEPVEEETFEIAVDVHGIRDGPQLGRMRAINKEPKLFDSDRFYLAGDFTPSYKGYVHDLVVAAGGTVLHRKPLTKDQEKLFHSSSVSETYIIYSLERPEAQKSSKGMSLSGRRAEAQMLADACGAKLATSSWIIDSIAASKLQPFT